MDGCPPRQPVLAVLNFWQLDAKVAVLHMTADAYNAMQVLFVW